MKQLTFKRCLIKYKDNDILLSSLLQFNEICKSQSQQMYLKNIDSSNIFYDVNQICQSIALDESLCHFKYPVQSLIYCFISIGNNDFSGKLWGISCQKLLNQL